MENNPTTHPNPNLHTNPTPNLSPNPTPNLSPNPDPSPKLNANPASDSNLNSNPRPHLDPAPQSAFSSRPTPQSALSSRPAPQSDPTAAPVDPEEITSAARAKGKLPAIILMTLAVLVVIGAILAAVMVLLFSDSQDQSPASEDTTLTQIQDKIEGAGFMVLPVPDNSTVVLTTGTTADDATDNSDASDEGTSNESADDTTDDNFTDDAADDDSTNDTTRKFTLDQTGFGYRDAQHAGYLVGYDARVDKFFGNNDAGYCMMDLSGSLEAMSLSPMQGATCMEKDQQAIEALYTQVLTYLDEFGLTASALTEFGQEKLRASAIIIE